MCCSTDHPTTCQDCIDLGETCIANHNQEKECKQLGYKNGKCADACPTNVPTTCEQCEALSAECREKQGFDKVCLKLNLGQFIPDKCPADCSAVETDEVKLTCADCQAISDDCMIQLGHSKLCKLKGLDKQDKCAEDYCPMANTEPTTCKECADVLGEDCVNRVCRL